MAWSAEAIWPLAQHLHTRQPLGKAHLHRGVLTSRLG